MEIDHNGKLAIDGLRRTIDSDWELITRHLRQFGLGVLYCNFVFEGSETRLLQEFLSVKSTLRLGLPVLGNACGHIEILGTGKLQQVSRGLHQSGDRNYLVPFCAHL